MASIISAAEAAALVRDRDVLIVGGNGGMGVAESVLVELERRFLEHAHPHSLTLFHVTGIGAVVGAMITMFAAVSQRTGEIGTLRALGFRRGAVLVAFLGESLLLALVGGLMGLAGASLMQTVNISTTNFQTFAELAFQFKLTPGIVVQTLVFALAMGFVGGFIPAWRAARLQIVDCLRAA